jgi:hypothetical protein
MRQKPDLINKLGFGAALLASFMMAATIISKDDKPERKTVDSEQAYKEMFAPAKAISEAPESRP